MYSCKPLIAVREISIKGQMRLCTPTLDASIKPTDLISQHYKRKKQNTKSVCACMAHLVFYTHTKSNHITKCVVPALGWPFKTIMKHRMLV